MEYMHTHKTEIDAAVEQQDMKAAINHLEYELIENFAAIWNTYCPEDQKNDWAPRLIFKLSLLPDQSTWDQMSDAQRETLQFIDLIWFSYQLECNADLDTPEERQEVYHNLCCFRTDLTDNMNKL